jgi:preprotein translocase subunit SecE
LAHTVEDMSKIADVKKFLGEAKGELKKVVWPSKKQTMASTKVVIVFVVILALFLGMVDFVLGHLVKFVLS